MAIERKWEAIPPQSISSNGTPQGLVAVQNPGLFKVKQIVKMFSDTTSVVQYEVKRVVPEGLYLGSKDSAIDRYADLTMWTTADNSKVSADEQQRPSIVPDAYNRAVYEEEPAVAKRNILVDSLGRKISSKVDEDGTVRLATSADFNVDNITIENLDVNLDAYGTTPDNVLSVGTETGDKFGTKHVSRIDSDLDLRVGLSNGANKALINPTGELSTIDAQTRAKLDSIIAQLAATLNTSDATAHNLLTTIIAGLVSIDAGIPTALGQTTMANSMPVNIASDQTPIKMSGTENGQPNGPEFTIVNNRIQQILKAKDRTGTISYADFGTKDQRITQITYTAPSIGSGMGFTAVKTFTYTLVGTRYRRDTPGDWSLL